MKLPLLPGGRALKLTQADGVLGGRIWPAASALCHYLLQANTHHSRNYSVECVELGSGTGAVGIYAAAALGYSVMLTEHRPPLASVMTSVPYSVDGILEVDEDYLQQKSNRLLNLLQTNIDDNMHLFQTGPPNHNNPRVVELDWSDRDQAQRVAALSSRSPSQQGFDLILASDVTYISQMHQPLADTIACLLAKPSIIRSSIDTTTTQSTYTSHHPHHETTPKCLVSHQERVLNLKGQDYQLVGFEQALAKAGLEISKRVEHPVYEEENDETHKVSILEIQHQSEEEGDDYGSSLASNTSKCGDDDDESTSSSSSSSSSSQQGVLWTP